MARADFGEPNVVMQFELLQRLKAGGDPLGKIDRGGPVGLAEPFDGGMRPADTAPRERLPDCPDEARPANGEDDSPDDLQSMREQIAEMQRKLDKMG